MNDVKKIIGKLSKYCHNNIKIIVVGQKRNPSVSITIGAVCLPAGIRFAPWEGPICAAALAPPPSGLPKQK